MPEEDWLAEARRLVYRLFCEDLARRYPGTVWRVERREESETDSCAEN